MTENELYNKAQKPNEYFLVVMLLYRRLAFPLAVMFRRLGFSANQVTILGGCLWIISVVTMISAAQSWINQHYWSAVIQLGLTIFLWNFGFVLDVADGSLARMTNTSSPAGSYLDYCFHLIFHPMFLCSIGIFLFIITGSLFYCIMGVLSTFCGWGVSFSSKEHVLCESIANGHHDPRKFNDDERYRIFIDSVKSKTPATKKKNSELLITLLREFLCFPGQYAFMSIVIISDIILLHFINSNFILLQITFVAMVGVSLLRVPFRIKREFMTLVTYEKILKKNCDDRDNQQS